MKNDLSILIQLIVLEHFEMTLRFINKIEILIMMIEKDPAHPDFNPVLAWSHFRTT